MQRDLAEKVVRQLLEFSAPFNTLSKISDHLGDLGASQEMRRHLAAIMMEVDEMLRPIVREYPDLDPDHP